MEKRESPGNQDDVYSKLLDMIRSWEHKSARLPPEDALAAGLKISRVKLRDILALLNAQGYINRKKGMGTVINRCAINETARLDIDVVYEEAIASYGFTPKTSVRKLQYLDKTPENVARYLQCPVDDPVWTVEKVIYADERPAIYLCDFIVPRYFNQKNIDMSLLAKSTFGFIQNYTKDILESIVVHVKASSSSEETAQALELTEGEPVLHLISVCFSFHSEPVLCSVENHNTDVLPYSFFKRMHRTKYYMGET